MENKKRNIEFLYEIGTIRFIPRIWRQFLNKDFANLSEHIFRVIWTAIIIAKEENADINKVIKMALIHDIVESRNSDVHYLSRMYTKRNDVAAIKDILKETSIEDEFLELFYEYEERKSIEAQIVKDADNLDVDFELQEQYVNGIKIKEDFQVMRDRVYEILFTETAKRMWKEIQNSNPHDWHINGNNRFNNGDWKNNE
jgi:putative hydrolases of HD superfamily|tara:strand:+ start:186 stop:782 length:597 start_codon:yes stop_codon:yes gene_type:complete